MATKKTMTAEQQYKRNKRKSKVFDTISPLMFYLFLALFLLFTYLALKNSIGNMTEIFTLLDSNVHSGEEIQANYEYLVEKWGEWEVIGEGKSGLVVRYIDVRNALFSGLATLYTILAICSICLSVILGKLLFPGLAKSYKGANEEMVDMATLKSATQIDEIVKKKKEEWF